MDKELWIDVTGLSEKKAYEVVSYALNTGYTGVCLDQKQFGLVDKIPKNNKLLIKTDYDNKDIIKKFITEHKDQRVIVLFDGSDKKIKTVFEENELGVFITINDKESMEKAIQLSKSYKTIVIHFESVTNIPLELVLAYSQQYNNTICKLITTGEDGWVASMTMEMGSQAVLLKSTNPEEIKALKDKVESLTGTKLSIEELKVESIQHIGMGDRVCIDTTSKLGEDEGMILGSTSAGGILVSSENHFLPYMELRPFRVNAGAIHSYVLCPNNQTKYLSELRAGDEVLAVNASGEARAVSVGRIKMERRPLLLIKSVAVNGSKVNVIVQDDWHIRIQSGKEEVKCSVLLEPGDTVLGYTMKEGRHLGVAIDETIIEK
ncbi:3-dehydroquinate synthase [Mobilitalea sibirica]|uniref:3-dehydroquinate synthase n=2 Tax=Mobilitalea sibirica TaxID=1462919 RepID=A0A8J7L2E7_9FIRM|nr:3-dehydroquinate synthase [Mobilitalea sibirica]